MKNMTHTTRIEFDATLPGYAEDVCIGFDRTTTFSHDASYGSDADGRRSIAVDMIDDDWYSGVSIDGVKEYHLGLMTQKQVETLIEAYMATHEPEMPEAPEPDDEPDDYEPYWEEQ